LEWFEGNFEDYEEGKKRMFGEDSVMPSRIKYKKFER
jgi:energy-dependent translational throttle protein EttA